MDLSKLWDVESLANERKELIAHVDMLDGTKGDQYIGVTLQGRYQDASTCDAVRPIVIERFKAKIARIDQQLRAFGVDPTA